MQFVVWLTLKLLNYMQNGWKFYVHLKCINHKIFFECSSLTTLILSLIFIAAWSSSSQSEEQEAAKGGSIQRVIPDCAVLWEMHVHLMSHLQLQSG